ncbi:MAG: FAD-dependent oxidoreductase [Dehalococcoidia bacterium]|nr:MAG: FAD-dependent oxidoreductase [Dehalococcoidia bacterium]
MRRSAEVVIVGGGVVGSSIAFHLAERGIRDVVLIDKGAFGSGTTAKGAGGLRSQFAEPAEIAFSEASLAFYRGFAERVGAGCGYEECGFLFLLRDAAAVDRFAAMAARSRAQGSDWRILQPEEVALLVPRIDTSGILGGSFTPRDGTAKPTLAARALLERARSMGVEAVAETTVTGFRFAGDRLDAVETTAGTITTRWAVIAAGPWAAEVGRLAGLDLPVVPMRRHVFTTLPVPWLEGAPMTIDEATGWYFRTEEGHALLVSAGDMTPAPDYDVRVREQFARAAREGLRRVLPSLGDLPFVAARAGLREMTPDERALLGPAPEREGMLLAVGFSGHGFMHAPAAGQAIADLIERGETAFDLEPFDPARFVKKD